MIVEVLITQRQRVQPLGHERAHRVFDLIRLQMDGETGRRQPDEIQPPIHLALW